jgi:hypothetical protein
VPVAVTAAAEEQAVVEPGQDEQPATADVIGDLDLHVTLYQTHLLGMHCLLLSAGCFAAGRGLELDLRELFHISACRRG